MLLDRSQIIVGLFATGLFVCGAGDLSAQNIDLANPDFESENFQLLETSLFLLSTQNATFEVPGWQQVGPPPDVESGFAFTGTFNNTESEFGPITFPEIGNSSDNPDVDTDRLAFLAVGQDPEVQVALFQETAAVFEVGQDYTFSLSVGASTTAPASSDSPLVDPAALVISIGYLDGSGDFVSIQDQVITQFIDDDIDSSNEIREGFEVLDNDPEFNLLRSFSVTAFDPSASDADLLGEGVAVQIESLGVAGGAGFFSVDTARLTQVPEPSSLALLGLGGVLAFRRRR